MEYYKMVMEYNAGACYCYAVQLWKGTAGKYKCKEGLKMLREMARAGMEPAIEYLNSIGQKILSDDNALSIILLINPSEICKLTQFNI